MMLVNVLNIDNYVCLDYQRPYPLDLFLSDTAINKYNRLFFTLLKVKTVQLTIRDTWKQLASI